MFFESTIQGKEKALKWNRPSQSAYDLANQTIILSFFGLLQQRIMPLHMPSSSIQTILSAPESDRINLSARGLYRRQGLAPCPEDLIQLIIQFIMDIYASFFCWQNRKKNKNHRPGRNGVQQKMSRKKRIWEKTLAFYHII